MPVNKAYIGKLRENLHDYQLKRRDIIRESGDALHFAKRAIFSIHRDDIKEAETKIKQAEDILHKLQVKYKSETKIKQEGSYKMALEEYAEAVLFYQYVTLGNIGSIKAVSVESDSYLGGLCDVVGELYRYAIKAATNRDIETVKKCSEEANGIIGELIEFDFTSYLRTKFDQAKKSAQKLELVVYELSLKD
jgi:translin